LRLARRLTFSLRAQRESKQRESAPGIRPGSSLRCAPVSFAASVLQGPAVKGHPWPITAFAASMPLNPLHTDAAHPADGVVGPCLSVTVSLEIQSFGSRTVPVRRLSAGAAQGGIWHGCQMRRAGPWMALRADPRSSAGAREVAHSATRMSGGVSLPRFLCTSKESRSPGRAKPKLPITLANQAEIQNNNCYGFPIH